jgi:hypothetical protein
MRAQTRPTDDPDCRPPAPWARLSLRQQQSFLSSLTTGKRKSFLESEADRILSDGRSARYQKNRDDRETHTDGRPLFDEFDGDKNNSDEDESSELILDGSQVPDELACGDEANEASEPHLLEAKDQESALASSWVDYSSDETLWGKNEWNAVRVLAPVSLKNRDILNGLAQGLSVADIAKRIGRTRRQVRNIVGDLWEYVRTLDVTDIRAHLDDPTTTEIVTRRPPSRAGRKPKGWVAPVTLDLLGDRIDPDHLPPRMRAVRRLGPRRPRVRPVCDGQMAFDFDWAA